MPLHEVENPALQQYLDDLTRSLKAEIDKVLQKLNRELSSHANQERQAITAHLQQTVPPQVRSLPWFKHGIRGFLNKLWHGDHPSNPTWAGYDEHLTLDQYRECRLFAEQCVDKMFGRVYSEVTSEVQDKLAQYRDTLMRLITKYVRAAANHAAIPDATIPVKSVRDYGGPPQPTPDAHKPASTTQATRPADQPTIGWDPAERSEFFASPSISYDGQFYQEPETTPDPEPKSPEPKSPEPKSPEPKSPEPKSPEPKSPEPKSPEPKSPEPKVKPEPTPDSKPEPIPTPEARPKPEVKAKSEPEIDSEEEPSDRFAADRPTRVNRALTGSRSAEQKLRDEIDKAVVQVQRSKGKTVEKRVPELVSAVGEMRRPSNRQAAISYMRSLGLDNQNPLHVNLVFPSYKHRIISDMSEGSLTGLKEINPDKRRMRNVPSHKTHFAPKFGEIPESVAYYVNLLREGKPDTLKIRSLPLDQRVQRYVELLQQ